MVPTTTHVSPGVKTSATLADNDVARCRAARRGATSAEEDGSDSLLEVDTVFVGFGGSGLGAQPDGYDDR